MSVTLTGLNEASAGRIGATFTTVPPAGGAVLTSLQFWYGETAGAEDQILLVPAAVGQGAGSFVVETQVLPVSTYFVKAKAEWSTPVTETTAEQSLTLAAPTSDLTTLASVKRYIGETVTASDSELRSLISSTSAFCLSYIGTDSILSASYVETLNGSGSPAQRMKHRPIQAVSALTVEGITVQASPSPMTPGFVYDSGSVYLRGTAVFPRAPQNVTVSYTAGYAVVPADLEESVRELVGLIFKERSRIGETSKTLGAAQSVSGLINPKDDVPARILRIWDNYKRLFF